MRLKLLAFFVIYSIALLSAEEKNCKYSNVEFDKIKLRDAKFKTTSWSYDSSELRIVTRTDDFLYLRKWACKTKGGLARLLIMTNGGFKNEDFILCQSKVLEIGKILLNDLDYSNLERAISKQKNNFEKFGTDMVLNIKNSKYHKFVVVISPLDNMIALSIMYYQD